MDHEQAARTQAPARYLLGDLSASEREEFEEHFFTCRECAEELGAGAAFAANARAVFREQMRRSPAVMHSHPGSWAWLRPALPLSLCGAMAVTLIGVSMHDRGVISSLRSELAGYSEVTSTPSYQIHAAERGDDQVFTVPKSASSFNVTFDIPPAEKNVPLAALIEDSLGKTGASVPLPRGSSATLRLPVAKYPAGPYTLVLRHASQDAKEVNRYRFSLAYE